MLDCVNESSFEGIFHNQITVVLKGKPTLTCFAYFFSPVKSLGSNVRATIIDDLSGTAILGEKIQLLGNMRRVFPEKSRGKAANLEYRHGIFFEVNNILRSRPPDYQMPECIGTVLKSMCDSIDV